jgi:hypothetical protein
MGSGNQQACSPFNGPGGTANPSFTISLNKQPVAARFQGVGQQCQNPCSSVLVMDPVGYATPGPQYDPSGNLLGPQINPFVLSATNTEAVVSHEGQWALRTANGVQTLGQFTQPVTLFGVTLYQFVAEGGP